MLSTFSRGSMQEYVASCKHAVIFLEAAGRYESRSHRVPVNCRRAEESESIDRNKVAS